MIHKDWHVVKSQQNQNPKVWKSLFYYLLMHLKQCWMSGKQCRPWSDAHSVISDLSPHCLLRPVVPIFRVLVHFYLTWAEGSGWAIVITFHLSSVHPSIYPLNNFSSATTGPVPSNFMWSHVLKEDLKFIQMVMVRKSRWPSGPYIIAPLDLQCKKNLKKSSSLKPWGPQLIYLVCSNV